MIMFLNFGWQLFLLSLFHPFDNVAAFSTAVTKPEQLSGVSTRTRSSPQSPNNLDETFPPPQPVHCQHYSDQEWKARCTLAVAYRIAHREDWHMNIFNHITVKIPSETSEKGEPLFLINDYGLGFDEMTASSLLKVTLNGTVVMDPENNNNNNALLPGAGGRVFQPGYILHSAVHAAREDCHAVWHCHPIETTALCQTKSVPTDDDSNNNNNNCPLLPLSQEALLALKKGISVHPFEGSANSVEEQPRIVKNLGPTNRILLLENHGPLVIGTDLREAYSTMWFLTRACKYQAQAMASVGGDLSRLNLPNQDMQREMEQRAKNFDQAGPQATLQSTKEESNGNGAAETATPQTFDTAPLMFDWARREAERYFGADNIYC